MHEVANLHFWLGVLAVNSAHPLAPGGGCQRVGSTGSFSEHGRIGKIFGQNTLLTAAAPAVPVSSLLQSCLPILRSLFQEIND